MIPVSTFAATYGRIFGTAIVSGAGFVIGSEVTAAVVRRVRRKGTAAATVAPTRESATEQLKTALANLAGQGRSIEDVFKDPEILAAFKAIDRAVSPGATASSAPSQQAA